MVDQDGDITTRNQAPTVEQTDLNTALGINLGYDYRRRGDEFQLRPAAVGFARRLRRIESFEHDALAIFPPQPFPQFGLLNGRERRLDQPDIRVR